MYKNDHSQEYSWRETIWKNGSERGLSKGNSYLIINCLYTKGVQKLYILAYSNKYYDIIYLDFGKAFDIMPHNMLLSKLKSHEVEVRFEAYQGVAQWLYAESWSKLCKGKLNALLVASQSDWAKI